MSEFSVSDREFMLRALELARQPVSSPHPNPRVGCVITRDGRIIGEGFHRKAGTEHAEVNALDAAGEQVQEGTLYVTLEPCSSYGRTPPCVDAVIAAGINRVVVCSADPNPAVDGHGISRLREAGITVDIGLLRDEARELNKGFLKRHTIGLPWVTVKTAVTLDGRTATATGESTWITGEQARADVQLLRARSDAILTGVGTVLVDNPRLTCRADGATSSSLRVIADSKLRTPSDAKLFRCDGDVIMATTANADSENRRKLEQVAEIIDFPIGRVGVNCAKILEMLAAREVNEVLVEAGPRLVGTLLEDNLVDEIIVYQAPSLIGDRGMGVAALSGLKKLSDRIEFEYTDVQRVGDNLRIMVRAVK